MITGLINLSSVWQKLELVWAPIFRAFRYFEQFFSSVLNNCQKFELVYIYRHRKEGEWRKVLEFYFFVVEYLRCLCMYFYHNPFPPSSELIATIVTSGVATVGMGSYYPPPYFFCQDCARDFLKIDENAGEGGGSSKSSKKFRKMMDQHQY